MEDNVLSRRKLLQRIIGSFAVLSSAGLLSGCQDKHQQQNNENAVAEPTDCSDLTSVSEEDIALRKKFAYVDESPIVDNQCNNCNLYLPATNGKKCGGCILFKGPVQASGYCTYWAPKV